MPLTVFVNITGSITDLFGTLAAGGKVRLEVSSTTGAIPDGSVLRLGPAPAAIQLDGTADMLAVPALPQTGYTDYRWNLVIEPDDERSQPIYVSGLSITANTTWAALAAQVTSGVPITPGAVADAAAYAAAAAASAAAANSEPAALANWRMALTQRDVQPVTVVNMGDSLAAGLVGAATARDRWINRLGDALKGAFNPSAIPGGYWLHSLDEPDWITAATGKSNAGLTTQSISLTAAQTMSVTAPSTNGVTVHYAQGPGAGAFTVDMYDGTTHTTWTITPDTSGTAGRHDGVTTLPRVPRGSYVVTITSTATTVISGVYFHDGDQFCGIQSYMGARGGRVASDFMSGATGADEHWRRMALLNPSLVLFETGANDWAGAVAPATFQSNVEAVITLIKTSAPNASIILFGPQTRFPQSAPVNAYSWSQYLTALQAVAANHTDCVTYADISSKFPVSDATDVYDLVLSDGTHYTARGHARVADILTKLLYTAPSAARAIIYPPTAPYSFATDAALVSAWKADDVAGVEGDLIQNWTPYAGTEAATLSQATAGRRPALRLAAAGGGHRALEFVQASLKSMSTAAWGTAVDAPLTTIFVTKVSPAALGGAISDGLTTKFTRLATDATLDAFVMSSGATSPNVESPPGAGNRWHIIVSVVNGTAYSYLYVDSLRATNGSTALTTPGLTGLRVNTNQSGSGGQLDQTVAEVAVLRRALTDFEVRQTIQSLALKYGISLHY